MRISESTARGATRITGPHRDIRISWESTPALFSATDWNTYDGAPDSNTDVIGYGKTEAEAVNNLLDQLSERGI